MFFIGIFSSIIPYLVIAGIYLLGIGIYSLESFQHKTCQADYNEQLIIEVTKKPVETNSIDYFPLDSSNLYEFFYSPPIRHKPFSEPGKRLLCYNHPPISYQVTHPVYFCRPPPIFLLS